MKRVIQWPAAAGSSRATQSATRVSDARTGAVVIAGHARATSRGSDLRDRFVTGRLVTGRRVGGRGGGLGPDVVAVGRVVLGGPRDRLVREPRQREPDRG